MIKNYTSTVPVDRTVSQIELALAKAGVSSISKEYGAKGELSSLTFSVNVSPERAYTIRLPAKMEAVYEFMKKEVTRPRRGTLERLRNQASRTAWKLMRDWVEVQLSLIQMQQAEFLQVFLPYVWDAKNKVTFYEGLKTGSFKALPEETGV